MLNFSNDKNIDKSSALDVWYHFFIKQRTTNIPDWYWFKLSGKKDKSILKRDEEEFFLEFYDLKREDLKFLIDYHPDEIMEEVKKFRKFNK